VIEKSLSYMLLLTDTVHTAFFLFLFLGPLFSVLPFLWNSLSLLKCLTLLFHNRESGVF
jgi:hypothetical protein